MPKKQRFSPSNLYKNRSFSQPPGPSRQEASVNELLARHRLESTPPPSPAKRAAVERIVSSPTLPPSIRQILDIPESEAPPPRRQPRGQRHGPTLRSMAPSPLRRAAARAARPPPGPAAPRSWMTGDLAGQLDARPASGTAKTFDEQCAEAERLLRRAPGVRWKFTNSRSRKEAAIEAGLDDVPMPDPKSLADMSLKSMARDWDFTVEYEQLNLASLPGHYKGWLLAYLGVFAPENILHPHQLRLMFLTNEELEGACGGNDVKFLNLSTLLGENLTCTDLRKIFEPPKRSKQTSKEKQIPLCNEVPTAWDEEADADDIPLPASLDLRFPVLTRLSLANPSAKSASWLELLSFSKHLATLTHLSLAYWPVPSMTPNAGTAVVVADRVPGEVSLGGTHMYSTLDGDWYEAANVLRLLSKNLYCLRWLDLEGCHGWFGALIYEGNTRPTSLSGPDASATRPWPPLLDHSTDEAGPSTEFDAYVNQKAGPDFNTYWQQLEYINMSQGWVPADAGEIQSLPTSVISIELLEYLRKRWMFGFPKVTTLPDASLSQVRKWILQEQLAREIARDIRLKRKQAGGKYLEVEYGWALDEFDGMDSGDEY